MTWIAAHSWLIPLIITVAVVVALLWFMVTVKGEETMAAPAVLALAIIIIAGSWVAWAVIKLLVWLF